MSNLKAPSLIYRADYQSFKNTEEQKRDKLAAKLLHKLLLRKAGLNPKKILNTPENSLPSKIIIHT